MKKMGNVTDFLFEEVEVEVYLYNIFVVLYCSLIL
jgi:hypothetical protein